MAALGEMTAMPRWKRNVTVFLASQSVTLFGSLLVQFAIIWHLTLLTQSGFVMALAAVFGFLPQAIVSGFAGVWVDRMNRRTLLIVADGATAATTLILALLMFLSVDELWPLFAILAVRSIAAGVRDPAMSALLPQITPTEQLMRVNGINGVIQSAMAFLAPAVAGVVYATGSIVAVLVINVITTAIGVGLLLLVPVVTIRTGATEHAAYFRDLLDGIRFIASVAFVRWLFLLLIFVFVLVAPFSSLTPLMITRSFGGPEWGLDEVSKLALLEICFGVGMLVAGALIAIWARANRVAILVVSSLAFAVFTFTTGVTTNLYLIFALMFAFGVAVQYFSTATVTLLQERVPPEKQGRIFGLVGIVMALAMPIGTGVFGPLADLVSVEVLLVIAGVAMLAVVTIAVTVPAGRRAMAAVSGREQARFEA